MQDQVAGEVCHLPGRGQRVPAEDPLRRVIGPEQADRFRQPVPVNGEVCIGLREVGAALRETCLDADPGRLAHQRPEDAGDREPADTARLGLDQNRAARVERHQLHGNRRIKGFL